MTERRTEVSKEYQRAVIRTEVFRERLDNYRMNRLVGPVETWDEVVKAQKVRAKSSLAFSRLDRQLSDYADSIPDLSSDLADVQDLVVMLTKQDDFGGLGESSWAYASIIEEYRRIKALDMPRKDLYSKINSLQAETAHIPKTNNLYINCDDHQAVIGDKLITFEETRDWEVFLHLVRNRGKILPREIERIARDYGATDANPSANSIRRLRRLIEEDSSKPVIITTNKPGTKDASYRFNLTEVRFYYPSRNSVENKTQEIQEKVLSLDSFRSESRRRQELKRRDPELSERINGIVQEVNNATSMITGKLVTLFQISHAFPNVKNEFIAEMQEKYINPQRRVGDKHPGFEKYEVAFMVYFRRFGSRLNLNPVLVKELIQVISVEVEKVDHAKLG